MKPVERAIKELIDTSSNLKTLTVFFFKFSKRRLKMYIKSIFRKSNRLLKFQNHLGNKLKSET